MVRLLVTSPSPMKRRAVPSSGSCRAGQAWARTNPLENLEILPFQYRSSGLALELQLYPDVAPLGLDRSHWNHFGSFVVRIRAQTALSLEELELPEAVTGDFWRPLVCRSCHPSGLRPASWLPGRPELVWETTACRSPRPLSPSL